MSSDDNQKITIIVMAMNVEEKTIMRVNVNTDLGRIIDTYARIHNKDPSTLRYNFDTKRLNRYDTPKTLEMEDDDIVEVYYNCFAG